MSVYRKKNGAKSAWIYIYNIHIDIVIGGSGGKKETTTTSGNARRARASFEDFRKSAGAKLYSFSPERANCRQLKADCHFSVLRSLARIECNCAPGDGEVISFEGDVEVNLNPITWDCICGERSLYGWAINGGEIFLRVIVYDVYVSFGESNDIVDYVYISTLNELFFQTLKD